MEHEVVHECERPAIYRKTVIKYTGTGGVWTYRHERSGSWINCIYYCPFCGKLLGEGDDDAVV